MRHHPLPLSLTRKHYRSPHAGYDSVLNGHNNNYRLSRRNGHGHPHTRIAFSRIPIRSNEAFPTRTYIYLHNHITSNALAEDANYLHKLLITFVIVTVE